MHIKKIFIEGLVFLLVLIALQTGCNQQPQKQDTVQSAAIAPQDSLKIFLQVKKMETKAYSMLQPGYYDSSLARYNQSLAYLNKALAANNNKGIYLLAGEVIEINQGMEAIYDSIHQPEKSIQCAFECLKWAKLIRDYPQQIRYDIHTGEKLKNMAEFTTNDTSKKGKLSREALQYAIAGGRVIDSLKTNDMDDLRYEDYHLTSKIYALAGDKNQARIYNQKYKDLYFKIYGKQPEGK